MIQDQPWKFGGQSNCATDLYLACAEAIVLVLRPAGMQCSATSFKRVDLHLHMILITSEGEDSLPIDKGLETM
jgi:hypothetical protein